MATKPLDLVDGLREHRRIHQLWVEHLKHCAGCPDCAKEIAPQVGTLETHIEHVAFYDSAIAEVESLRKAAKP